MPHGPHNISSARTLAFTQFAIVGLGVMAIYLLTGIGDKPSGPAFVAALSSLIGRYGAWLVLVPPLYALFAWSSLHNGVRASVVNGIGIGLTVFLVLVFTVPLFFHFL